MKVSDDITLYYSGNQSSGIFYEINYFSYKSLEDKNPP